SLAREPSGIQITVPLLDFGDRNRIGSQRFGQMADSLVGGQPDFLGRRFRKRNEVGTPRRRLAAGEGNGPSDGYDDAVAVRLHGGGGHCPAVPGWECPSASS